MDIDKGDFKPRAATSVCQKPNDDKSKWFSILLTQRRTIWKLIHLLNGFYISVFPYLSLFRDSRGTNWIYLVGKDNKLFFTTFLKLELKLSRNRKMLKLSWKQITPFSKNHSFLFNSNWTSNFKGPRRNYFSSSEDNFCLWFEKFGYINFWASRCNNCALNL